MLDASKDSLSNGDEGEKKAEGPSRLHSGSVLCGYMFCSSTMLIINKVAVKLFPVPTILLFIQLLFSSVAIKVLDCAGQLKSDPLEMDKIKKYLGVMVVFMLNIYTNIKCLEVSTVETVIVFRTCTSLAISFGDYKFLGKGAPSLETLGSLFLIIVGAVCYAITDKEFDFKIYFWVLAYFTMQCTDVLYIKHIVNSVPMTSWGRSFYNNTLALVPTLALAITVNEHTKLLKILEEESLSVTLIVMVLLSCLMGLGISVLAFMSRALVSATSYSVLGNVCKVLTVVINCIIWDDHASAAGVASLMISLAGGAWYSQAVQRRQS